MVLQANEALRALEAGDIFGLSRKSIELGVDNAFAVDPNTALGAIAANAHGLPFTGLFGYALARRLHGINRSGELHWLQVLPLGAVIIEHLNFQPGHPRCTVLRCANEHAAVAVCGDVVFELQLKIGVLLLSGNPRGAGFAGTGKHAVVHLPVGQGPAHALPAGEVFAVEERFKFLVGGRCRKHAECDR